MTRSRKILPPRKFWTEDDIAVVRDCYPNERTEDIANRLGRKVGAVYQRAQSMGLRKSAAFLASPASGRTNGRQGIGTRFEKGHVSHNKGLRRPGYAPGRMAETQFKKGHGRSGVAVDLYKPIGTERISKDGYLERKVNDGMPLQKRWRAVHLILWESINGPLPKGFAVTFINGDRKDIRIENLTLVSRADLCRRNTIHRLPAELKSAIHTLGTLKRRIRRREREEQDRRSA